jgi:hypothetical protein
VPWSDNEEEVSSLVLAFCSPLSSAGFAKACIKHNSWLLLNEWRSILWSSRNQSFLDRGDLEYLTAKIAPNAECGWFFSMVAVAWSTQVSQM